MNDPFCTPTIKITARDRHAMFEQNYADLSEKIRQWALEGKSRAEIEVLILQVRRCSSFLLSACRHEIEYWQAKT